MDVTKILEKHALGNKDVHVQKLYPLSFDLGLLAAFDENILGEEITNQEALETKLMQTTRDATQLLINNIFSLPRESTDDGIFANLPKPTSIIPREKPVPKEKPLTRWEKFAKLKGIHKTKKDRMVFDEETGELRPAWGYKGINKKEEEQWLIPLPSNADSSHDVRKSLAKKRKDLMEKNKKRQKRNTEEAAQLDAKKNLSLNPKDKRKQQLKKSLVISKTSTASMGKFDNKVEGEPKVRKQKRKLPSVNRSALDEREINKSILSKLF
ncbi:hypothetical protein BB560_002238 [Smittium megazygosporum]|uniref:Ribosome biogenesis regulatory protein n=1 Tax=Smittium megazygosporum TaxID=133381 RepID=A0A2T9ZFB2_9FUNG|nr:hypothetical protein BB560_002238 [Smittium megazygosporum]